MAWSACESEGDRCCRHFLQSQGSGMHNKDIPKEMWSAIAQNFWQNTVLQHTIFTNNVFVCVAIVIDVRIIHPFKIRYLLNIPNKNWFPSVVFCSATNLSMRMNYNGLGAESGCTFCRRIGDLDSWRHDQLTRLVAWTLHYAQEDRDTAVF